MSDKEVWLITGAGRGMGVDIAQSALAAGHAVVATGRDTEAVADAVGAGDDLLVVELDITSPESVHAAVQAAVDSSAPACSRRNPPPTPTCRSTTTPAARRRPGPPGKR